MNLKHNDDLNILIQTNREQTKTWHSIIDHAINQSINYYKYEIQNIHVNNSTISILYAIAN